MLPISIALLVIAQSPDDPSGFVPALNAERAARGLPAVAHDPAAVEVAAQNNSHQAAYGLGHHVLGGLGQCAGVGLHDALSALHAWLGSPSHAAILLDPGLVSVGCHGAGGCWTASTRSSGVRAITVIPVWCEFTPTQCYPARRGGWRWRR